MVIASSTRGFTTPRAATPTVMNRTQGLQVRMKRAQYISSLLVRLRSKVLRKITES